MTERGLRKGLVGTVVSNRMEKTVVVLVERLTKHAIYKKYIRSRSKYMAHDPRNSCAIGDKVRITENRPISKNKRWRVSERIEKSHIQS
ncbi:MAG: 30S ribosomal protein S17 [Desulfatiglandaceae bacterium]